MFLGLDDVLAQRLGFFGTGLVGLYQLLASFDGFPDFAFAQVAEISGIAQSCCSLVTGRLCLLLLQLMHPLQFVLIGLDVLGGGLRVVDEPLPVLLLCRECALGQFGATVQLVAHQLVLLLALAYALLYGLLLAAGGTLGFHAVLLQVFLGIHDALCQTLGHRRAAVERVDQLPCGGYRLAYLLGAVPAQVAQ